MSLNMKRDKKHHPITPYGRNYTHLEIERLSYREQAQHYLDSHNMSIIAQTKLRNNWEHVLAEWKVGLPFK